MPDPGADLRVQLLAAELTFHMEIAEDGHASGVGHSNAEAVERALAVFQPVLDKQTAEVADKRTEITILRRSVEGYASDLTALRQESGRERQEYLRMLDKLVEAGIEFPPGAQGVAELAKQRDSERARAESAETARDRFREALLLIGTDCEAFTGPLTCVDDEGRSPHGKYLVDRWCDGCIARMALKQPEEGHHA